MDRDFGLDTLLDLDGIIIEQKYGYWVKFDVSKTDVSPERPHGIRYSLTLHNKYGPKNNGLRQCPCGEIISKKQVCWSKN